MPESEFSNALLFPGFDYNSRSCVFFSSSGRFGVHQSRLAGLLRTNFTCRSGNPGRRICATRGTPRTHSRPNGTLTYRPVLARSIRHTWISDASNLRRIAISTTTIYQPAVLTTRERSLATKAPTSREFIILLSTMLQLIKRQFCKHIVHLVTHIIGIKLVIFYPHIKLNSWSAWKHTNSPSSSIGVFWTYEFVTIKEIRRSWSAVTAHLGEAIELSGFDSFKYTYV